MSSPEVHPPEASEARLDDRIVDLLQKDGGRLAFNGLRRSLSAHPESLSRALRRLERFGVVVHESSGYALVASTALASRSERRPPFRSIGSVELPALADRRWVFGQLAGRWFGKLRWVGIYESSTDPWLVWSTEGSSHQVYLSLRGRRLEVGIDTAGSDEIDGLERAAVDLLRLSLARLVPPVLPETHGISTFRSVRLNLSGTPN